MVPTEVNSVLVETKKGHFSRNSFESLELV